MTGRRPSFTFRAFLFGVALVIAIACGGESPIRIATLGTYHPFDFINEDGEIDGLERELGDELCSRARLDCEWVLNDWESMIPDLVAGEFDVILAGMTITAGRAEIIDFTRSYYPPAPSVYLAKAGAGDAAVDGVIGAGANTVYSDYLSESGIPFASLDIAEDPVEAILSGRVDTVLVDHGFGVQKVDQHQGKLEIVGPPLSVGGGLGIGVRKGSDLKAKLDEALTSMKDDGTLNQLIVKWVGEDAYTFE